MIFDFVEYVRSIRYRRWRMARVGTRISQVFALQFVFGLTHNKSFKRVSGRVNRFRKWWLGRLRDMAGNGLWLPTKDKRPPDDPDFDREQFTNSFRRCMFCRPTAVQFSAHEGKPVNIRPCWRTHICPFCWSNLASAQYVYAKQTVNALVKRDSNFVAVCRIVREYVPAPGFNYLAPPDAAQIPEYAARLNRVIRKHKARYAKLVASKALQRKTLGSAWRLVVVPDEAGWQVEIRQFFLCRRGTKPPIVNTRGCRVVFAESIALNNDRLKLLENFYNLFGEFCRYPIELLTGYYQLVAAYLNAAHDERLVSGTGVLRKTGQALIPFMREQAARAKAKKKAKAAERDGSEETVAQDPGYPAAS